MQRGFGTGPVAIAVAVEHFVHQRGGGLEGLAFADLPVAEQGVHAFRLGLALHGDQIDLQGRESAVDLLGGLGADDDRRAIFLGAAFQPRGEVHGIAQHRIIEAQIRTHIADHAGAGIDAEPDLHREKRYAVLQRLCLALVIEIVDPPQHVERCRAGMGLVIAVVERSVPERHDGVADIFVDRSLALDDGVGQRRQQPVHQLREALRIVLEGLRDGGEAAHVAEQDRHVAHFAAQHELLGELASCSTRVGEMYWLKAPRIRRRSACSRK